jgi:hypothetical protein
MKYIMLSYDDGSQMVVEGLGPETVIGMVTDVVRGNYDETTRQMMSKKVVKVEAGDMLDMGTRWAIPTPMGQQQQGEPSVASGASG